MTNASRQRIIIQDGPHTTEVLRILERDIQWPEFRRTITEKALQIIERAVDPNAGPPEHPSDGLLYGLIQSGKTSIITVASAMAADNGFHCIIILTSDIDILYDQTIERIRKALRGLNVLGKNDWADRLRFERQLSTPPFVIVCSKNSNKLNGLLEALRVARAGSLSSLIFDDEADQASLNTYTSRGGEQVSRINESITEIRNFFRVNTYLQVTATPQALFLQKPDHRYRPSFSVLSEPGPEYVGGEIFFGTDDYLRTVNIEEVEELRTTHQPAPTAVVPRGLKQALCTFLVGATSKIIQNPIGGYALLCHVSINKSDHEHIVNLIDRFKDDTLNILREPGSAQYDRVVQDLREAYDDLSRTDSTLPDFNLIVEKITFYLAGANIKLINASSDEEIKLDSVYNIFVGGNKLGRGVTIKNLLVSYYGRNPQRPNADTVLQHARMYGYRQRDLGVTRLFLPGKLAQHFRFIQQMESALRDLVSRHPQGQFEGIFIPDPLRATRPNVLDPNSIGMYVAGGYCNPIYPLRTQEVAENTEWLDERLTPFVDTVEFYEVTIDLLIELIQKCEHDPARGAELWNKKILVAALQKIQTLFGNRAYLRVKRNRDLNEPRRETQGFLTGGEVSLVPKDAPTLFIYRLNRSPRGGEVWWPQLKFPDGEYVLAFSFIRN